MKTKKNNIAIFTHNYPITSQERKDAGIFIYDFAHELSKTNNISIFCPDFGGKKEKYEAVPVEWFDWGGPKIKFGNWSFYSPVSVINFLKLLFIGARRADQFVRKNNIEYILAAWTIPSSLYAYWIHKRYKIPYGVWILGSDLNIYGKLPILRQLTILALKNAKTRFSNSYWLINKTQEMSGKKCVYMAAITDFKPSKTKPRKLNNKIFNFVFVGRLEKVKGPDVLVEACHELIKTNTNFHLNILGDGTLKIDLKKMLSNYHLDKYVTLFGNADRNEVESFMKSSDSLIVASRAESIPLVMVEAARVGLPTVATDVGDCKRAIDKYKLGLVANTEDPKDLSRVMSKAIKQGKNFKRLHQKGLRQISSDFKQTEAVNTLLKYVA